MRRRRSGAARPAAARRGSRRAGPGRSADATCRRCACRSPADQRSRCWSALRRHGGSPRSCAGEPGSLRREPDDGVARGRAAADARARVSAPQAGAEAAVDARSAAGGNPWLARSGAWASVQAVLSRLRVLAPDRFLRGPGALDQRLQRRRPALRARIPLSSRPIAAPKDGRDTSQPSDTSVTRYMRPTRIAPLSSAPGRQVMHRVCCRHDGWPRSLRLRDLATTSTSAVSHAKSRLDRLQSPSVS